MYSCAMAVPARAAAARAILRKADWADGAHAPVDSVTNGTKTTPALAQAASVPKWARLVPSYAMAADNAFPAAARRISCRWGAVTAKSSAAGDPPCHEGR